jgi:DNA-binding GntR family transcriptional regulator
VVTAAEPSASDRAYRWTRERIFGGTFVGGEMISEGDVAEALGISRTPVREAFLRLSSEGVLRLFPKRGAVVVPVTESDTRDILEARLVIEPWAVVRAASRPDRARLTDTLTGLIDTLVAAGRAGDAVAYQESDRAFHEAILTAAGNRLLTDFYRTLRDRQLRVGAAVVATTAGRADTIVVEHRQIAAAIAAGDAPAAERAVRGHIETTREALRSPPGPA